VAIEEEILGVGRGKEGALEEGRRVFGGEIFLQKSSELGG
jgi:hypothetical protein